jgi:hypothetical protein
LDTEFAFICDFAEQDRKLHAVGIGWDQITARSVPHRQPNIGVVTRLRGSIAEKGTKDISIRLIDADGRDVIPAIQQQVEFNPNGLEGHVNVVVQMSNIPLSTYGAYAIHVLVAGEQKARLAFNLVEAASQSPQ